MNGRRDICRSERTVDLFGNEPYPLLKEVLQERTYNIKRQQEYSSHYHYEKRYRRKLAGKYLIYLSRALVLLALMRLDHGLGAKSLYEAETHIRDSSGTV